MKPAGILVQPDDRPIRIPNTAAGRRLIHLALKLEAAKTAA